MFGSIKKSRIFASLFRNKIIELWCNGNTADFGSVILGSNPGSSTQKTPSSRLGLGVFCVWNICEMQGVYTRSGDVDQTVECLSLIKHPCITLKPTTNDCSTTNQTSPTP